MVVSYLTCYHINKRHRYLINFNVPTHGTWQETNLLTTFYLLVPHPMSCSNHSYLSYFPSIIPWVLVHACHLDCFSPLMPVLRVGSSWPWAPLHTTPWCLCFPFLPFLLFFSPLTFLLPPVILCPPTQQTWGLPTSLLPNLRMQATLFSQSGIIWEAKLHSIIFMYLRVCS